MVLEVGAGGVPGGDGAGVGQRGQSDHLQAPLPGVLGQLHGHGLPARERDQEQQVTAGGGGEVQGGGGESGDPLQGTRQRRRHDRDPGHAGDLQQVDRHQPAGPVDHVLGRQRGVAGTEREDPAVPGDRLGEQGGGRLDVLRLLGPHPLEVGDRGLEVPADQLAHLLPSLSAGGGPGRVARPRWSGPLVEKATASTVLPHRCRCQQARNAGPRGLGRARLSSRYVRIGGEDPEERSQRRCLG